MKIAIVSDIHANELAFNEVLKDIEKFNPDKIFCLGDLIMAGYNPNGVMSTIFSLKEKYKENFKIIQGNTDNMVANAKSEHIELIKEKFPCMGYSLEEDMKITDKKYIDFVRNLPITIETVENGLKIQLVHGSVRRQDENIYPNLLEKNVEEMVKDSNSELILCGHTHKPCGYALSIGKTVINVGSVGRSMTDDKMPTYLQLTIDENGQYYTEHRIIKYDNKVVFNHILSRNFKHCEELAEMFI